MIAANPLLFTGPRGAGKGTVARLLGSIFADIGLLPRGHVVEVSRPDLVGKYVGETAIKTLSQVEEAQGGVLLIRGMHEIAPVGSPNDFGHEALATLLQQMDGQKRFTLVGVGPPELALATKPGLHSRFDEVITFSGYSDKELLEILVVRLGANGSRLDDDTTPYLSSWLDWQRQLMGNDFDNARAIERLHRDMETRLAVRVQSDGAADVSLFVGDDVPRSTG